jgi:hypothetical protein
MPNADSTMQDDEHIPLLQSRPTPLPARQMSALMLLLLAEPIMGLSILPYINEVCPPTTIAPQRSNELDPQLVTGLPITDGDEKKVGYYAGLIVRYTILLCEELWSDISIIY